MRHYVLTLILSAFFLTSNGQEIIGDPDINPRKPISLASNRQIPPQFKTVSNNKFSIPVTYNFALSPRKMEKLFQSISHSINIEFYLEGDLLYTIHEPASYSDINSDHVSIHCLDCDESTRTNYSMTVDHLVDIGNHQELSVYNCDDINKMVVHVQVILYGVTMNNTVYSIFPIDYNHCNSPSPWPHACYTSEEFDNIKFRLLCEEYNSNEIRGGNDKSNSINSKLRTSLYTLNGLPIAKINRPGMYIVCQEKNNKSKCHVQYLYHY